MATTTENVGLTQPAGTEKYSLEVNNENLAKIDAALGELQEAVGTGSGGGLGDKVGNYDDTEAGTVFGDLNIIKEQTEQNGTDIAEVKQTANGNSDKLTALQATAGNTKTVVDVINTNVGTVKQNTETLKTSVDGVSAKVENINGNVSENGTKLDTIANKADVISGQVQTVGNNVNTVKTDVASVKTTVENVGGKVDTANSNISSVKTTVEDTNSKVDTALTLLNNLQTALDNANTNIATLLTQSKGVKAISSGKVNTNTSNKATATIPSTMNTSKVVILTTTYSSNTNEASGLSWEIEGYTITFSCKYQREIRYQIIEFY